MSEESLFELAVNTPEAERAALLDRECGGDAALRARIEVLLAAHFASSSPLDPPPNGTCTFSAPDRTASHHAPAETEGTVVAGRYKLLQLIGEGGMGTVWMADQIEPVKRRVAVKLIRTERGQSKTILSRFEAERQAIALMDHPHIAKLLDAGTTETGSPFFVMELVKGVPLNEFCDTHKLSIPDRLHLFMQICSAVQHAHQKGVIHRDLKPSNILVESHDGKPVPKVIDFGLAKATTGLQLTEHTLFTGFGSVMGTPLYMAPEQAAFNAVDVDTRADVYALGVILYELLTGTTPLTRETLKAAALDEMLRLIREQDAPTPSSRLSTSDSKPSVAANRQTEPAKLGRFVKGELDWIVLKALSKDRDRRYESATGFAKDVERFLNHEPVQAGPPSASYRLRKFVRRNRPQVVAAGLVLLAMVAGIVGTTLGMQQARISEQAAVAAWREEARQRGLADDRLAQVNQEKQRAERLLKLALDTHGDLVADLHGAWKAPAKLRDAVVVTLAGHAETIHRELEGGANFENAWAISIEDLAGLYALSGKKERAAEMFAQATRLREKLHHDEPTNDEYTERLGKNYRNRGMFHMTWRVEPAAVEWYDRAVAVLKPLVGRGGPDVRARGALLDVYRRRAEALLALGRPREAAEQWDVALRLDTGDWQLLFRHERAIALAGAGDHRGAIAEADALTKLVSAPSAVFLRGRAYSLASAAAATDASLPETERRRLTAEYAAGALRLIRTAVEGGYGAEQLAGDPHLNPIRDRDDFKKLVAELGKKAEKK